MLTKVGSSIVILLATMIISGCWDQYLIKDVNLIFTAGIDRNEEGKFFTSVTIPEQETNTEAPIVRMATGIGNTLRESRNNIDNTVDGILDSSKIRVLLVESILAEEDLYAMLDLYYRDPRAPLNAKIAITEVKAHDALDIDIEGQTLISDYYSKLIEGAEKRSIIPKMNIQYICPLMVDPGRDFMLPIISIGTSNEKEVALISGAALFHGKIMTGKISTRESVMANLLNNIMYEDAQFTVEIAEKEEIMNALNYITVQVEEFDRMLHVKVNKEGEIEVDLDVNLYFNVAEFPPDSLDEAKIADLNKKITKELSDLATTVVEKIQAANCDYFGVGREVMAYHKQQLKDRDWNEIYPNIPIEVTVKAEIIQHGIIN
ncbi:Ger(x)C family spore germination protein [Alkalihalobacillus sp. MEB130]|uniref:Ger(x)C family spore germination protein n=1 Tax=Alkalihalobacillus sp. MEB130 TaxID=2976704 RepID=UPI0028E091F1|nr:Ger(x)C family spore germination protein [Alkalihalobacillus sp. MEB130]MDT8861496.1 Ger(x)C family spore germination protein [Alkalihalobacillus sp. MEB130]